MNTLVDNRLNVSTPIIVLCIRLYPLVWFGFPCLRMEVLGCVPNDTTGVNISDQQPHVISQGILSSL